MRSLPLLYPHLSFSFLKKQEMPKDLYFFNSGRSGFELIIQDLKGKYDHLIFLIPAYTCSSVVFALTSQEVEFDFVDLDDSLDFDLQDLRLMIEKYENKKIVLVPTSLFGANIREYKKSHPDLIVVEDKAQSSVDHQSSSDYQFVSFGRGKLVSSWNGGAVFTQLETFKDLCEKVETAHGFLFSYLLANIQIFISKYFYSLIEKTPLNPEKEETTVIHKENFIYRPSKIKINWILNSLNTLSNKKRVENTQQYFEKIDKKYQFAISGENLLRFPIKKVVKFTGVSYLYDYRYTYETAIKKRDKKMDVPRQLAYQCSFLPTHSLVDRKYITKITKLINE